jgi:hypothetical protein
VRFYQQTALPGSWACEAYFLLIVIAVGVIGFSSPVAAADEIQVYNADINDPGHWSLQLHANYAAKGRRAPLFPGGMVPDGAVNGTPELAYGVNEFWELGAYLPYAVTRDGEFHSGGGKLRTLFVSPNAQERNFFYGVNFELGWAPSLFSDNRWNVEIRPIVGVRFQPIEFIVNPIVDVPVSGTDRRFEFNPAARLAYLLSDTWAVGLEHYSGLGPIDRSPGFSRQEHTLYVVTDYASELVDVNFGVGRGYTGASDAWMVKMILGHSF